MTKNKESGLWQKFVKTTRAGTLVTIACLSLASGCGSQVGYKFTKEDAETHPWRKSEAYNGAYRKNFEEGRNVLAKNNENRASMGSFHNSGVNYLPIVRDKNDRFQPEEFLAHGNTLVLPNDFVQYYAEMTTDIDTGNTHNPYECKSCANKHVLVNPTYFSLMDARKNIESP